MPPVASQEGAGGFFSKFKVLRLTCEDVFGGLTSKISCDIVVNMGNRSGSAAKQSPTRGSIMEIEQIRREISPFTAEMANIRFFFKEWRSSSAFQDWLWKVMPRLKAVTNKIPRGGLFLGCWGKDDVFDRAVLYSDLLTCMVLTGEIEKCRGKTGYFYRTRQKEAEKAVLDKVAKPSYTVADPF
jgi:hypothetical protein